MKPIVIGIRDLHRNIAAIAKATKRGRTFVVAKHAKPLFRIQPMEERHTHIFTLADLVSLQFKSRHKRLSQDVDRVTYGI